MSDNTRDLENGLSVKHTSHWHTILDETRSDLAEVVGSKKENPSRSQPRILK